VAFSTRTVLSLSVGLLLCSLFLLLGSSWTFFLLRPLLGLFRLVVVVLVLFVQRRPPRDGAMTSLIDDVIRTWTKP